MSDKDENIIEERVFNIPLRGVGELIPPREERRSLRSSIEKHMKIEA
jgi:hypothetical protein